MSENTNVGTPALQGADGNQPPVSQGEGQPIAGTPQGSQELLDLKKQFDLLRKEIGGLQSRQDKEKNDVQRFMDEVKQQMGKGLTLEEAERAVTDSRKAQEKDDLLFRIAQKIGVLDNSSQPPAAGNGVTVTNDAAQVIARAGLDANSAEVIELIRQHGNNPVDFALGLGELKARQAAKPQPSAAASTSIQGGPGATEKSGEALTEEYKTKMRAARGNRPQLTAIRNEYIEKGVKVWEVDFS